MMRSALKILLCVGVVGTTGSSLAGGKFPSFGIIPGHIGGDHLPSLTDCRLLPAYITVSCDDRNSPTYILLGSLTQ
jgi:hypothetical protein